MGNASFARLMRAPAETGPARTYVVLPGETLKVIAAKHGCSVEQLKAVNEDKIKRWGTVEGFNAGETIVIPGGTASPATDTPSAGSGEPTWWDTASGLFDDATEGIEEGIGAATEFAEGLWDSGMDLLEGLWPGPSEQQPAPHAGEDGADGSAPHDEVVPAPGSSCALTTYSHSNLAGRECVIDSEFVSAMDTIMSKAAARKVTLRINDAYRSVGRAVNGAIVPPASNSNHHAGHAIDFNPVYEGETFHSSRIYRRFVDDEDSALPEDLRDFFKDIRAASDVRWGGDFTTREDPVHIDDALNKSNPTEYAARVKATQEAWEEKCVG